ncbi:MAG: hypothetical protein ACI8P9_002143 [Parasphingorhabdus sp.]|jgi:hypothetical protein
MLATKPLGREEFNSAAHTVGRSALKVLDHRRVMSALHSYVGRRVSRHKMATLLPDATPASGDLMLIKIKSIGRFSYLEVSDFTVSPLKEGQEIIACFSTLDESGGGLGVMPSQSGGYQLLSQAGIVSQVTNRAYLPDTSTDVEVLGVLGDTQGLRINIRDWAIPPVLHQNFTQPIIAVIGEVRMPGEPSRSLDMIRGLSSSGFNVGAANITGAPGCWKLRLFRNAGAKLAVDLTDAGYAGTSGLTVQSFERIFQSLSGHLAENGVDIVILEFEQSVFGHDTASIISMPCFQSRISTVILEAKPGRGAELERDSLRAMGFDVTLVDLVDSPPQYVSLT